MDLDEEIKSREEGEIGSESREKGDLLPCSSPLHIYVKSLHRLVSFLILLYSTQLTTVLVV